MLAVLAMGAAMASATVAQASVRIFSYEPTNDATRRTAGPLTFEFDQRLVFTKVLWVRSTEGRARADLKPANEGVLGRGGLSAGRSSSATFAPAASLHAASTRFTPVAFEANGTVRDARGLTSRT